MKSDKLTTYQPTQTYMLELQYTRPSLLPRKLSSDLSADEPTTSTTLNTPRLNCKLYTTIIVLYRTEIVITLSTESRTASGTSFRPQKGRNQTKSTQNLRGHGGQKLAQVEIEFSIVSNRGECQVSDAFYWIKKYCS